MKAGVWVNLGEAMVRKGTLKPSDMERCLEVSRRTRKEPRRVLLDLGTISEEDLRDVVAEHFRLEVWERERDGVYPVVDFLPVTFMRSNLLFPLKVDDERLEVAVVLPMEAWLKESMERASNRQVFSFIATEKDIVASLNEIYFADSKGASEADDDKGGVEVTEEIERLRDLASEAPVIRWVGQAFSRALELGASDIHIEPFEREVVVRYRVDGVLREEEKIAPRMFAAVVSRIKIISGLNIAERRLPQDGRNEVRIGGRDVDLRVSIIPVSNGEDVVIRILDRASASLNLDKLGITEDVLKNFRRLIHRAYGLILLTGPTGSGKTTTLFSALREIRSPEMKIITVEDPIEYRLDGVNQIQAKPEIGLTFASGLRSILRHDPDVILIGEIRDAETASIAVQSALTGHLVFSTLHTNDAPSAFARLIDMGIQDYLVSSAVIGVMAQRLIRKTCDACREKYLPNSDIRDAIGIDVDVPLYRAKGCDECGGTGYRGRESVVELLEVNEAIRKAVLARKGADHLYQVGVAEGVGFKSLWQDAVSKVVRGRTSVEEIFREVGGDRYASCIS